MLAKNPSQKIARLTAMITAFALASGVLEAQTLPKRAGPIPQTTDGVPHVQLNHSSPDHIKDQLLDCVGRIPGVEIRDTVISLPGAKGFWLSEGMDLENQDSIVGGREFAHIHPDGSLHASLDPDFAPQAIGAGWAISHPWADRRVGWEGFVMIYSPTNAAELDVVFQLVVESYEFITGRKVTPNAC